MINKITIRLMRITTIFGFSRNIALFFAKMFTNKKLARIENTDIVLDPEKIVSEIKENGFSSLIKISDQRLQRIIDYSNSSVFRELNSEDTYKIDYDNPKKTF
jgi:hypothetical protein